MKFNGVEVDTSEWLAKPEEVKRVREGVEGLHEEHPGLFNELRYMVLLGQLEGTDPKMSYEPLARLLRPYVYR